MSRDEELLAYLNELAKRIHPRREELVDLVIEAVREQVIENEKAVEDATRYRDAILELEKAAQGEYQETLERTGDPVKASQAALKARETAANQRQQDLSPVDRTFDCWPFDIESPPSTVSEKALFLSSVHDATYGLGEDSIFGAAAEKAKTNGKSDDPLSNRIWIALGLQRIAATELGEDVPRLIPVKLNPIGLEAATERWFAELLPEVGTEESSPEVGTAESAPEVRKAESSPEVGTAETTDLEANQDVGHSPDFRSLRWYGTEYSFTSNQSKVVQVLFEAWQNGTPEVGAETLLQAIDHAHPPARIDSVFRNCDAWKSIILPGATKGTYRLGPPD